MYNKLKDEFGVGSFSKPTGYPDVSDQKFDEILNDVAQERIIKEQSKSKPKRPQTAHYPIKPEYSSKYQAPKPKTRKKAWYKASNKDSK